MSSLKEDFKSRGRTQVSQQRLLLVVGSLLTATSFFLSGCNKSSDSGGGGGGAAVGTSGSVRSMMVGVSQIMGQGSRGPQGNTQGPVYGEIQSSEKPAKTPQQKEAEAKQEKLANKLKSCKVDYKNDPIEGENSSSLVQVNTDSSCAVSMKFTTKSSNNLPAKEIVNVVQGTFTIQDPELQSEYGGLKEGTLYSDSKSINATGEAGRFEANFKVSAKTTGGLSVSSNGTITSQMTPQGVKAYFRDVQNVNGTTLTYEAEITEQDPNGRFKINGVVVTGEQFEKEYHSPVNQQN